MPLQTQAQITATRIVADPTATRTQQATILNAGNGVVQVNIQTPSAAGVSRNIYSQFDVGNQGAILNNSRSHVQTQLGGWVQGNPWLATGSARVILNEVNSSNPSQLRGYVEVAGQRAEVVIANPAGIAVNGGGFINASGVTLTTGTPMLNNGNLDSYRVQRGAVSIDGNGLDTRTADYTAILARAAQVNAGIWAKQLQVVTGANEIQSTSIGVDTSPQTTALTGAGTQPAYALDVSQLGGMYAGKITLIGTEAGLGVRNAGLMQASSGPLTLTQEGWLSNSGTIHTTGGDVSVTTRGTIEQSGTVYSDKNILLNSQAGQTHSGTVAALGDVRIAAVGPNPETNGAQILGASSVVWAAGLKADGQLSGQQNLSVLANGQVQSAGTVLATGQLSVKGLSLDLSQSKLQASSAQLRASSGDIQAKSSRILIGGSLQLQTPQTLVTEQANIQASILTIQANSLSNAAGQIVQTGSTDQNIYLQGTLNNSAGVLQSGANNLAISAQSIDNTAGQMLHAGSGNFNLGSRDLLLNQLSSSAQAPVTDGGRIVSMGDLHVTSGVLTNSANITAAKNLNTSVTSLNNSGTLYAADTQTLAATNAITSSGTVAAGKNLSVSAASFSGSTGNVLAAGMAADGRLTDPGALDVNTTGTLQSAGQALASAHVVLSGGTLDLSRSTVGSTASGGEGNVSLIAISGDLLTQGAQISSPGLLTVTANNIATQKFDNTSGQLSGQQVQIRAGTINNNRGRIEQTGTDVQTASILSTGTINNSAGTIIANAQDLAIGAGGALTNIDGLIGHAGAGTFDLNIASADNTRGQIIGNGSARLTSAGDVNNTNGLVAAQSLDIVATGWNNSEGKVLSTQVDLGLRISQNGLNNSKGLIQSAQDLTLTLSGVGNSLQNQQGKIYAERDATLSTGRLSNDAALISAGRKLSIDTHGQTLSNLDSRTNDTSGTSTAPLGLIAGGQMDISSGDLDNRAGLISAQAAVKINSNGTVNNAAKGNSSGLIYSGADLTLQATGVENTAGQILAVQNANIHSDTGQLNNATGLVRVGHTLTVQVASVDNTGTRAFNSDGTPQSMGLEGNTIALTTQGLNNTQGAIRVAQDLSIHSDGQLINDQGELSAGRNLQIDSQQATTPTLRMSNGAGRIVADTAVRLTVGSLSGAGTIASKGDVSLSLQGDHTLAGTLQAGGDLSLQTTGTLSNPVSVQASKNLSVRAQNLNNQAGGELISGQTTDLSITDTLTNRGLIDGADTRIQAQSINNLGSGRIYGDRVAIAATTLINQEETLAGSTAAATIAGRERVDIGVQTLTNRENALIYSGGDMAIGGALDANWRANTAKTRLIVNEGANIDAAGNLLLQTDTLKNLASGLTYALQPQSSQQVTEYTTNRGLVYGTDVGWQPAGEEALVLKSSIYAAPKFKAIYEGVAAYTEGRWTYSGEDSYFVEPSTNYSASDAIWGIMGVAAPTGAPPAYYVTSTDMYGDTRNTVNPDYETQIQPWKNLQAKIDAMKADVKANWASYAQRQIRNYTETTNTPVVTGGLIGKISAGKDIALDISDQLLNQDSQMVAGGAISNIGLTTLNKINNIQTLAEGSITKTGTQTDWAVVGEHCWWSWSGRHCRDVYGWSNSTYSQSTPTASYLQTLKYEQYMTNASTNATPTASTLGAINASAGTAKPVNIALTASSQSAVTGTQANQASTAQTRSSTGTSGSAAYTHVKTTLPNTQLPGTSLYKTHPESHAKYLVETDPQFANYRNWLGSDYMLRALSLDPAAMQKRLGDGFYEQKLVREQVLALTGNRYLGDYRDDEQQYQALMDAGLTYARQWSLRPGIALSAEQVAQLTSDMVWLVTQEVTLADGTRQSVLVPQVYVRVQPGDVDGNGALLAGQDVQLNLSGDLSNSGTIAGRKLVQINAQSIRNLGGQMSADTLKLNAKEDIANVGGSLRAQSAAILSAGRDIELTTTTQSSAGRTGVSSYSQTGIDRVAGLYVSGPEGVLLASAGRDLNLRAAQISNVGTGATQLSAGRDLNLGVVSTSLSQDTTFGANRYLRTEQSQDVGSQISAGAGLSLSAGQDLNAKAASVRAAGGLTVQAGGSVNINAGQASQREDMARESKSSGWFSKSSSVTRTSSTSSTAVGSSFEGESVSISAGKDLSVKGSSVLADQNVNLSAGGSVNITAAQNTSASSSFRQESKSGLMSGGGLSVSVGKQQQSLDQGQTQTTAAASTVGSVGGSVSITAGQGYTQTGSDVVAPGGDISISAKSVSIQEARETGSQSTEQKFEQTSISVGLKGGIIDSVQAATQAVEAAKDSGSNRNRNLNALMAYAKGSDAYEQGKAVQGAYNKNGVMGGTNADGTSAPGGAAASGIKVSVSIGTSKSQSNSSTTSDTAAGSTVKAGGNVSIKATGQGETQGNLTVQGSNVSAAKDVSLSATKDVNILASADTQSNRSSNSASSTSVGVSVGIGQGGAGLSLDIAASRGKGQTNSDSTTYNNSHISGGKAVNITSGADTNVVGGNIKATQVTADVGGSLNVQSLQDKAVSEANQKTTGIALNIPIVGTGGSASQSKQNSNSHYASVNEQSGIQAGDGGFQVNVKGNTDLKGATIASSDKAAQDGKNTLSTNTLTTSDISNSMSASASSSGVSVGSNMMDGKYAMGKAVAGNALNNGSASQSDASTTTSAISGAQVTVGNKTTDTSKEQLTDSNGKAVSTDTGNTSRTLAKADMEGLQKSAQEQQAGNMLILQTAVAFTDQAFKAAFLDQAKMYKKVPVTDDKGNTTTQWQEMTPEEKAKIGPGSRIANNGIFNGDPNDPKAAQDLAEQNSSGAAQYLIHFPQANTWVAELLVAGYQKFLENGTTGLTNATQQNVDLWKQTDGNITLDGHSRGGMTVGNALDAVKDQGSKGGTTNVNLFGSAYNAQDAANTVNQITGGMGKVTSQVHKDDFVGMVLGGNAATGGTIPTGSSTLQEWIKMLGGESTVHSNYGDGKKIPDEKGGTKSGVDDYWGGKKPISQTVLPNEKNSSSPAGVGK